MIALLLSSCALTPPDVQVCVRLPFGEGARCNNTLRDSPYDMNEAEYMKQEIGMVFMSPESYGEIKKFVIKACEKNDKCEIEKTKKRLDNLEVYYGL